MSNPHIVIHQGIFARSQAKLTLAGLQGMQILNHTLVVGHESKGSSHLAKDNGLPPENFGTFFGIHPSIIHAVTTANHKPAETHFFHRFHKTPFLIPRWRIPTAGTEGVCHLHNPFRLDFGGLVEKDAASLSNLGTKEPFYTLAIKIAAREHMSLSTAHQAIAAVLNVTKGYTAQKSRKKGDMQVIPMETVQRAHPILELHV